MANAFLEKSHEYFTGAAVVHKKRNDTSEAASAHASRYFESLRTISHVERLWGHPSVMYHTR